MTVWLDADAYTALQLLTRHQQIDASTVAAAALRHYHAVTSYQPTIASSSNTPVMPVLKLELENRILVLRQSGLSLSAIAEREQCSIITVIKSLTHANSRHSRGKKGSDDLQKLSIRRYK